MGLHRNSRLRLLLQPILVPIQWSRSLLAARPILHVLAAAAAAAGVCLTEWFRVRAHGIAHC